METSDAKKRQQFLFRIWCSAHAHGWDISMEENHEYLEALLCGDEKTCCTLVATIEGRRKSK